jgi:EVE domain-containing protein
MVEEADQNYRHRNWIIVASRDHVLNGVREGIAQASHGKQTPLRRMNKDDNIIYYSPKMVYGQNEKCQRFTAIGKIKDNDIFEVKLNETFSPFRRRVEYFHECKEIPIENLIPVLSLIKNKKSWGNVFRLGLIQIPDNDFLTISKEMRPDKTHAFVM